MQYLLGGAAAIIAAAAAWSLLHAIPASGAGVELSNKLVNQCARVDVAPGAEDVTIDPDLGLAFISAADRRGWYAKDAEQSVNPRNGIYAMSMDGSDVRKVSPPMENFLPHGVSLWRGPNGEKRLFVISHPPTGEELVELFDIAADGALTHLETISFPQMKSPNDLVAVGPRQFYVTNDQKFDRGFLAAMEAYLALPLSNVAYYDGENGRIAKGGIAYANGINQSADGKTIYVAELLKRRILVFDRDIETGELSRVKALKINTAPDNIEVSRDGALWVAGHSRIFEFLEHAKDENAKAPSHVIRLNPRNGLASDVLISVNGEINASSVGAVWANTLIVGAVFDGHVMVCPMLEILLRGPAATQQ
ncbi:strictosidine synthase family protein [Hyphococcus sp.]|uniref:strictosidine synthase family protein n=1 Tax=Hyphococcus sp. TaxID=2038636 RepID=UPI003CCC3FEA